MRTILGLFALVSMLVPAVAEDLDQRRTFLLEDEWMARVVIEPLEPDAKDPRKSSGVGSVHFLNGLDDAAIVVRRAERRGGTRVRYRIKPAKTSAIRVRGSIRTRDADESLRSIALKLRGKAPRRKVKGTAGVRLLFHDGALTVPTFDVSFVQVIHDESHPELTDVAGLTIAPSGDVVVVGHIGVTSDGERERETVLRATRWTVRSGRLVDEEYLGPDEGVALGVSHGGGLVVGRMSFSGSTSSDALWIVNGNGFHVTDFGSAASGIVFEATHVAGDTQNELIAVLRVLTGGAGTVRWSSVGGETLLQLPRETVSRTVFGMDARGDVLVGDARADGRARAPFAATWDRDGAVTRLSVGREAGSSARAVSSDGKLAAGVLLDLFTDIDPLHQHVVWDLTDTDRPAVPIRTLFGGHTDGGANAGPAAITDSGFVAGWDTRGSFVWQSGWPDAVALGDYLEGAGLALPAGEAHVLKGAIDVVDGHILLGTTRVGSGERIAASHWVAFVKTAD